MEGKGAGIIQAQWDNFANRQGCKFQGRSRKVLLLHVLKDIVSFSCFSKVHKIAILTHSTRHVISEKITVMSVFLLGIEPLCTAVKNKIKN
jgi:hypothetical protein